MNPLLLLLALGFLPGEDGLAVGPPAPHMAWDSTAQALWAGSAAARDFRERFGPLQLRFDPSDRSPRALLGPGPSISRADELVDALAEMAGVPGYTVQLVDERTVGERVVRRYAQSWRGVPVEGGGVDLFSENGRIVLGWARLHRVAGLPEPLAGERVLFLPGEGHPLAALVRRHEQGDLVRFVDRDGVELHRYTTRLHLELTVEERTVGDPLITAPAREVAVVSDQASDTTDHTGAHSVGAPFDVEFVGPHLELSDAGVLATVASVDDELLDGGVDMDLAVATVQHHYHAVRDWLELRDPTHALLPVQVRANVNDPNGSCNASYSNASLNFLSESERCNNLGRIADVVYHEVGHGIHHYALEGGTFASDVSEGSADFVSCTLLDDHRVGLESSPGSFIREIDTDRRYPEDASGQSHNDGLIWASFLWNLRTDWMERDGAEAGLAAVDELFVRTLRYGPTLTDIYEAVIAADDDDGDLSNGTPHDCELMERLGEHGIGPGPMGVVVLEHDPLGPQGSAEPSYPVDFALHELTAECGDFDPESARVFYTVNPPVGVALEELEWEELTPAHTDSAYSAELARQFPGTQLAYFIEWASADGSQVATTHQGRIGGLHRFWVGDREPLWCEDFESGWGGWEHGAGEPYRADPPDERWASQWEIAAPEGQSFCPDTAWSGSSVLGTAVTGTGQYRNNNHQHVLSPEVSWEEPQGERVLLAARRWLTVEDGLYDRARVFVDLGDSAAVLFENGATEGGTEHLLDDAWVQADLELTDWRSWKAPVRFGWALESDPGLEFGGWALDDVCVVSIGGVHSDWRVRDLVASDDSEQVELSWTWPYVRSLAGGLLVKRADGPPEGPEDGEVLASFELPEVGSTATWSDPDLAPGESAWYAVFTASESEAWFAELVDGENLDEGRVPAPPPPEDTAVVDTGGSPLEPPPLATGCGCGVSGHGVSGHGGRAAAPLLALLLPLLRRRERYRVPPASPPEVA